MKRIKVILSIIPLLICASLAAANDMDAALRQKIETSSMSEKISAIVYMKDKIDLSKLPKNISARMSALEEISRSSQKDISSYLNNEKKKGRIGSFNKFWIFNGFAISANKDVLIDIAKRTDVDRVELNRSISLPPEIKVRPEAVMDIFALATVEANISQIKADQVWDNYNIKGKGIKVGIADTGCLLTHVDVKDRISLSATFDNLGTKISDTTTDTSGHGTHVAGIVAGGNASGKYIGVAPEATLLIAKVFNDDSSSAYAQVAGGVQWLVENGAKIVNLSLGASSGEAVAFWKTQVDAWTVTGVIIVAAIGNYGPGASTTTSPANVPNAFGVGYVDSSDTIASLSSRGPIVWSGTSYTKPDICAPGSAIKSSWKDGGYNNQTGTSMASPHVAGVIALMYQANASLDATSIKTILKNTTYKNGSITYPNNDYGYGRVDALNAVSTCIGTDETAPTIEAISVSGSKYGENITVSSTVTDNITGRPYVYLYYKSDTNIWENTACSSETGSSRYSGVIPGTKIISNMKYYIKASDIAGNTSYAPSTAPTDYYTVIITPKDTVSLSDYSTCPNPYAPGSGNMTLSFYLSKPSDIILRVFNISGEIIKTFSSSGTLGYNSFLWDGILDTGEIAGNGVYVYQITARDSSGSETTARSKIILLR